jgi:hypothetical protein
MADNQNMEPARGRARGRPRTRVDTPQTVSKAQRIFYLIYKLNLMLQNIPVGLYLETLNVPSSEDLASSSSVVLTPFSPPASTDFSQGPSSVITMSKF